MDSHTLVLVYERQFGLMLLSAIGYVGRDWVLFSWCNVQFRLVLDQVERKDVRVDFWNPGVLEDLILNTLKITFKVSKNSEKNST